MCCCWRTVTFARKNRLPQKFRIFILLGGLSTITKARLSKQKRRFCKLADNGRASKAFKSFLSFIFTWTRRRRRRRRKAWKRIVKRSRSSSIDFYLKNYVENEWKNDRAISSSAVATAVASLIKGFKISDSCNWFVLCNWIRSSTEKKLT